MEFYSALDFRRLEVVLANESGTNSDNKQRIVVRVRSDFTCDFANENNFRRVIENDCKEIL